MNSTLAAPKAGQTPKKRRAEMTRFAAGHALPFTLVGIAGEEDADTPDHAPRVDELAYRYISCRRLSPLVCSRSCMSQVNQFLALFIPTRCT
jgi:hypothetical protein